MIQRNNKSPFPSMQRATICYVLVVVMKHCLCHRLFFFLKKRKKLADANYWADEHDCVSCVFA